MIKTKKNKECNECLGKGFHYEGFDDAELCYKCHGTGKIKNDKS